MASRMVAARSNLGSHATALRRVRNPFRCRAPETYHSYRWVVAVLEATDPPPWSLNPMDVAARNRLDTQADFTRLRLDVLTEFSPVGGS